MKISICEHCKELKEQTKHSLTGHHLPPYILLCRECHDKVHDMGKRTDKNKYNSKYSKDTKNKKLRKTRRYNKL